jgi:hypothetical protein
LTPSNEDADAEHSLTANTKQTKPMSVILTTVVQPTQARATLTAADVSAFQALLGGAGLVTLPEGKTPADIVSFIVNVQPNGGGFLSVAVK